MGSMGRDGKRIRASIHFDKSILGSSGSIAEQKQTDMEINRNHDLGYEVLSTLEENAPKIPPHQP